MVLLVHVIGAGEVPTKKRRENGQFRAGAVRLTDKEEKKKWVLKTSFVYAILIPFRFGAK